MADMRLTKIPMAEQPPEVRNKNFLEVACGYTAAEAAGEAERCLNCKNRPCVGKCPVGVPIPDFIAEIRGGDLRRSYEILSGANALPSVCGRVCPQERQCESACVRGIKGESVAIGRLERFVADNAHEKGYTNTDRAPANGKRVAVVGSGPAGLTCAEELARLGYSVKIFEAFHKAGGVLSYGIPEFRLPKTIVQGEVEKLKKLGVEIETDMVIGRILTVDELFEMGYSAVFLGTGAGLPQFMGVPGENLVGVYSANEYLTRINLMKAYLPDSETPVLLSKNVVVVGGGNVAMDSARCAKRMGAERVTIVYRRSEAELPARAEEVHHAKEEGIEFLMLCAPVEIKGDENGRAAEIVLQRMELGEPDASGRRRPVPVPGSEFTLPADTVIPAIGTSPNPLVRMTTLGLDANKKGCIVTGEDGGTSKVGVFAGGDIATGSATVILAMGAGKRAAQSIDEFLRDK